MNRNQNKTPTGPVSFGPLGSYTFGQSKLMPGPPRNLPPPPQPMPCKPIPTSARLSPDEAKEILAKWAKSKCCRSDKPALEGHVTDSYSCNALQYTLETFTEKRGIVANYAACRAGENIDPVQGGAIVNPWQLPCNPDAPFSNHEKRLNMPKTDVIQPCFRCQSFGRLKCSSKWDL